MNIKARTILVTLIASIVFVPKVALSQSMMGTQSAILSDGNTASEEAEGKEIWEKLQAKQLECKNLTDDNFEVLGEYFMGQILAPSAAEGVGSSHEVMNNMMVQMIGGEGEEQMHIAMGKRNSGCDASAAFPQNGVGFMPMMGSDFGNMMSGWGSASWLIGILGWLSMLLFWILLILGVVALIRYLGGSGKRSDENKPASLVGGSPLDILRERYAKGEINKREFEERKKELI